MSCPDISQQNGVAEMKHWHIVEIGLTMMFHANVCTKYWVEAFLSAIYLINHLPYAPLKNETLYFCLFKTHPDYGILKVFGCRCHPYMKKATKHKFSIKIHS